jgi:hypothetical protein
MSPKQPQQPTTTMAIETEAEHVVAAAGEILLGLADIHFTVGDQLAVAERLLMVLAGYVLIKSDDADVETNRAALLAGLDEIREKVRRLDAEQIRERTTTMLHQELTARHKPGRA